MLDTPDSRSEFVTKVLGNWEEELRHSIPRIQGISSELLVDQLPAVLGNLTEVLANDGDRVNPQETLRLSLEHGHQRASLAKFSLEEVLLEFSVLRRVIFEELRSRYDLDIRIVRIVHQFIDECIRVTVLEYSRIQNEVIHNQAEDLRNEKALKERFIAALSHDMRTPLAAALMSLGMVAKKIDDKVSAEKYLQKTTSHLKRLDMMIQDFLDVTLIKSGKLAPISYETFYLEPLIREVLEDLSLIHGDRFRGNFANETLVTLGSKAVRRIVENLCSNAIKYGDPEAPVEVRVVTLDDTFQLSVKNEGNPMDEKTKAEIFHLFARSPEAWGNNTTGWGIGLPLVKGLAEAQGGSIDVESSPQSGTIFTVTLPLRPKTRSLEN